MNATEPSPELVRDIWTTRLTRGKPGFLVVRSGSMQPLLRVGERIRVVPGRGLRLPGDLLVYQQEGKLVCHRLLIQYAPGRYVLKGDLNRLPEKVAGNEILGKADGLQTPAENIDLNGARFRFWNGLMLATVIMRAIWQLPGIFLQRGGCQGDGIFINVLEFIADKIRKPGSEQ